MLIGIVGFIHSGKSTVGDYLVEHYGFERDSFAAPLKDLIAKVFNWPRNLLEGDTPESRNWRNIPDIWWEESLKWQETKFAIKFPRFTPRVCLQIFGTEIVRDGFNTNIWISSLRNRLRQVEKDTIITDCRFPNEVESIRQEKGIIIRVKRGEDPTWFSIAEGANAPNFLHKEEYMKHMLDLDIHISEWAWIGSHFDYEIINDGSLSSLYISIDKIMEDNHFGHKKLP